MSPRNDRQRSPERSLNADSVQEQTWYRDRLVQYREVNGLAIMEGDIILGPADALKRQRGKRDSTLDASIITDGSYRWAGGEVPYVVDKNATLQSAVSGAIRHWESNTSYRFVARTDQKDFVHFVSVPGQGCASYVGRQVGEQPVFLESGCGVGAAIHEIGHAVGLWHEQSRHDRNDYVVVNEANISPSMAYNFDITGREGTDVGYYDFGSIMHYADWDFSDNGLPTLVTIPAGITIGQSNGLSPADIDAVERMNGAAQRPYVITSNPPGFPVTVDGVACSTPCSFPNWQAGSRHTLSVDSLEYLAGTPRTHGVFARWNDNGAQTHDIVADPTRSVITANFLASIEGDLPDLVVTSIAAPAAVTAGQGTVNVNVTVQNTGKIAAGPFKVGFYLSGDASITRSDRYLGWYCAFDTGLVAGATATCRGAVDVPAEIPTGAYYFGAMADDLVEVGESNELNNSLAASATTQVTSEVAALPDLTVASFSAPVTGTVGGKLAGARIELINRGQGVAGRFRVGVYLSKSGTLAVTDTYTRWSCTATGLAAGDRFTCTGDIGIPSGLAAGTYYLEAIADDLGQVTESEESNNGRVNDAGRVTLAAEANPRADLIVTSLTAPTSVTRGQRVNPVMVEVQNVGGAPAGAFRIGFYLSTLPAVTTSNLAGDRSCTVSGLAAGATYQCLVDLAIPLSLKPGTYYLGAIADDLAAVAENDETNNSRLNDNGPLAYFLLPRPDLVVTALSAPATATGTIQGIGLTVQNQGGGAAGPFRVSLFLSAISLGVSCESEGLAAGATFSCVGDVTVPQSVKPGKYTLRAIVDYDNAVAESDETNNSRANALGEGWIAPTPRPDLVVTSFTAPATVTVKNQGTAAAGKFRIGFYKGCEFTGWYCMVPGGLAAGESFSCTRTPDVPADRAIVDDLRQVVESDETNN